MIRVASITPESTVDGEGWRYVIFTQGCNHNCKGCHNPQTHSFDGGYLMNTDDILKEVMDNPLLDGITLSGGDPFFQAKELLELVRELKKNCYSIWAYTGFVFDKFLDFIANKDTDKRINKDMIELLNYIDVVVDGPFIESKKTFTCEYRGSSNQRLVDVRESLDKKTVVEI